MCVWNKELRQAFQEAIIRGHPFTVLDIRNRVRDLTYTKPPTVMMVPPSADPVDYKTVKYELLTLMEQNRPAGWTLSTIPVVDSDDVPHNVWQFTPIRLLDSVEQMSRKVKEAEPPVVADPGRSILQRILAWGRR